MVKTAQHEAARNDALFSLPVPVTPPQSTFVSLLDASCSGEKMKSLVHDTWTVLETEQYTLARRAAHIPLPPPAGKLGSALAEMLRPKPN